MRSSRILVVDDEPMVRKMISRILQSEGMLVFQASNGADAIRMSKEQSFDLMILDIMMEGMDGFQVIHELREEGILTPLLVLSGRQSEGDQVFALGIGADDYVIKPFSSSVLCAKVKACLRRVNIAGCKTALLEEGPFAYNCEEMRLTKLGKEIPLSSKESFLMRYFLSNPGTVLSKEQIYTHVWGDNIVDDNTIMVHIRRLRTKIEDDPNQPVYLRTVRGVGYQFLIP